MDYNHSISAKTVGTASCRPLFSGMVYALIQSFKTAFLMQGAVCKFEPSCSRYAREAFEKLPLHIAATKIIWRILRCNPFSKGGFDPVMKGILINE